MQVTGECYLRLAAVGGEAYAAEEDGFAVFDPFGVFYGDEFCFCQDGEIDIQFFAGEVRTGSAAGELGQKTADREAGDRAQGVQDGLHAIQIDFRGGSVLLGGAFAGAAEIAEAAAGLAVFGVAEVEDQGGHAALVAVDEFLDELELVAAVVGLACVGRGPAVVAASGVVVVVDGCAAVDEELFDGFGEGFFIEVEAGADFVERLRVVGQGFVNLLNGVDRRVVALEEEIMCPDVCVGVHQDGAAGVAVTSSAADFLVVAFEGAGQSRVDDSPDIGFVDAHAKGDGGYYAVELAGLEVLLDGFADL